MTACVGSLETDQCFTRIINFSGITYVQVFSFDSLVINSMYKIRLCESKILWLISFVLRKITNLKRQKMVKINNK